MSKIHIRLDRNQSRKRIAYIVHHSPGQVRFSRHALEELRKDRLTTVDVMNVMKSPDAQIVDEPEHQEDCGRGCF